MWARVFREDESALSPEAIAERLRSLGYATEACADADDLGWFHLDLRTNVGAMTLDRYLADEGIRDDLNTWAAWLESHAGADAPRLMQHMISTRQIITLRCQDEVEPDLRRLLHQTLTLLTQPSGLYQLDGEGFFGASGALLVSEAAA